MEAVSEHLCWKSYVITFCVQRIKWTRKSMWSPGFYHFILSIMCLIQEDWLGFAFLNNCRKNNYRYLKKEIIHFQVGVSQAELDWELLFFCPFSMKLLFPK